MFLIFDRIKKTPPRKTENIKTAADIIVGITGEERDYELSQHIMSDMVWGDTYDNGRYHIDCMSEEAAKLYDTKCKYCEGGKPLTINKTNNQGIAIQYPNRLIAYGYDIHGSGRNGLVTRINYCPMCGKKLSK